MRTSEFHLLASDSLNNQLLDLMVEFTPRCEASNVQLINVHLANFVTATDQRLDRLETRMDRVETRLDRLEMRVDRIDAKLDRLLEHFGVSVAEDANDHL